jgi:hypothetical protein
MHLSVSMNASALSNTERDRFVGLITKFRTSDLACAAFVPLLREYLADHDAIGLVARTLETGTVQASSVV